MHSLKQTAVAVILLGLTYVLYQVSLTPSEISKPPAGDAASVSESSAPKTDFNSNKLSANNLPEVKLPEIKLPEVKLPEAKLPSSTGADTKLTGSTGPKGIEIPRMPEFSPGPSLSIPETNNPSEKSPPSRSADSSGNDVRSGLLAESVALPDRSAASEAIPGRKAVETIIENGVEKIKHHDMLETNPTGSQIAQREPSAASRDQGLIEALNTQAPINPANSINPLKDSQPAAAQGSNQFVATMPPTLVTTPIANPIQPIGEAAKPVAGAESEAPKPRISQTELEKLTYKTVWPKVDELVESGDFHSALKALSRFYKDENLNGPQRQRLMAWMDALAAKVIFSSEDHLTEKPYVTQANESLSDISNRWSVPVRLISNINGSNLANLNALPAGTQLKQVPGPFHAELKLNAGVITLFLGDLYAGRFSVVIGTAGEVKPGTYDVVLKSEQGFTWRDPSGKDHAPGTPENGYGSWWMGLSNSLCIHSVPEKAENGHRGCIGLSEKDAADLFSILSEKSKLVIVP